ncbi:hypothetical protein GPECTOR_29g120 [Gonium pectorale]|uniref:Uncharacterized protein n=1 Tax=Gonium pectorale TaxID=33097 RepID=A0A150GF64_GONPE|nr:hypothetical protein GPECTOR_29g120 [Gonium pectorale]|eukprot:KXZ48215.1 hypothetical protein GPECTOR_29g120 [Gonium pectorale]
MARSRSPKPGSAASALILASFLILSLSTCAKPDATDGSSHGDHDCNCEGTAAAGARAQAGINLAASPNATSFKAPGGEVVNTVVATPQQAISATAAQQPSPPAGGKAAAVATAFEAHHPWFWKTHPFLAAAIQDKTNRKLLSRQQPQKMNLQVGVGQ